MAQNRLVTLCGTGGVGKTRLAIQIASASELRDGLCFVDLAPITESGIVAATAARAVGLPDQPGRSTMDSLRRFIGNRRMLMVLDNCEHLLDACAALVVELLGACPELTILATSREPIGMAGEITWRVPSMSITDEAVELFADRASRVQPGFTIANHNAAAVGEICRRLDGIPLAIEFAAARVRSMSPLEIADGLDDCFRLLAGGVRGAVQRQQTLRASIDWSHALLTETEQILFRRLAPFVGGFDLAAVRAVAAGSDLDPFSVLDQLTLLVDKSLVVADDCQGRTRYRLLETVRRYALEKLGDSGEADVHARHRDYYTALAASLNTPADNDHQRLVARAETEIDNLRAAFAWSRENGHITEALQLASSLQPIWFGRAHLREGLSWFNSILEDQRFHRLAVSTAVRARALADKAMLSTWLATSPVGATDIIAPAQQALAMAREVGDPAALVRALTACGCSSGYNAEAAAPYFAEATDLARAIDDKWTLCQILYWRARHPTMCRQRFYQPAVPQRIIDECSTVTARFMTRWQGEPDPRHIEAIDAYWVSAAEHGMNASTFTARVIASTGADVAAALSGAIGAMSGPLHGGAPARVLPMLDEVERAGDARSVVKGILDRGEKLMGFGHRVYRAEDPRARVLRAAAERLGAPRYEVAVAVEQAALSELRERRPDRAIETNVEFWAAVVLDFARVPANMMPAMFTCGRTAGWCAHILEQKRLGKLVRPSAIYVGPGPRSPESVDGWERVLTTA